MFEPPSLPFSNVRFQSNRPPYGTGILCGEKGRNRRINQYFITLVTFQNKAPRLAKGSIGSRGSHEGWSSPNDLWCVGGSLTPSQFLFLFSSVNDSECRY
ncbi:hypothetical protein CDAR_282811 [Caerostris darwini]|uniref:Ycf15 n=1 Tax=Caerostris darwini TaxID=1538125 RepID=A0AAV4W5P8_9ARAC|nr:hypothetical protein CDAR_282811 [Caerostris darwini]